MGKHNTFVPAYNKVLTAAVTLGGTAAPVLGSLAVPAQAAPEAVWDRLAMCESTQRWDVNTGNGFYGGLQFDISTWNAYKTVLGPNAPDRADHATRGQQIAVAEATLADRVKRFGVERAWTMSWPACSAKLGIRDVLPGGPRNVPEPPAPPRALPAPAPAPLPPPAPPAPPVPPGGTHEVTHVVAPGEWLSRLAQHYGECGPDADFSQCWHAAYERNRGVIGDNPDILRPGEKLTFLVSDGTQPMATEHVVQSGETLGGIAHHYGLKLADLYLANRDQISNPNLITVGMRLKLQGTQPPVGTAAPAPTTSHAAPFAVPIEGMPIMQVFKGMDHRGIDIRGVNNKTPMFAAADIEIIEAEPAQGFGLWIVGRTVVDGTTFDLVYGHMNSLNGVKVGQHYKAGDLLAYVGVNGNVQPANAAHLHFEVWVGGRYKGHPIDPVGWLRARGVM